MVESYRLVNLCEPCATKRVRRKPLRAEPTLLDASLKYCIDCQDYASCGAYRDYGRDEPKP